ncbi:MAG: heavy metal translocating P-type ATPase [Planctomycetales bacterium]|nr:heavy metal translocating P-type ATPase [Planctomycetales bacterium]
MSGMRTAAANPPLDSAAASVSPALGEPLATATRPSSLPCVHCGLPTDCSTDSDPSRVFCCAGCLGAYQLIHGWGLEDFYALREQMKSSGTARAASKDSRYEQFDSLEFLGPSRPTEFSDGTCGAEFAVHGLHCGACAWLIENAAAREAGLLSARVRMSDHTVRVQFDPQRTKLSRVARLFDSLGYGLAPIDAQRDRQIQIASRRLLVQIAIAGFLAANAMWIAVALYAGEYSGVEPQYRYFLGLVGISLGVSAVLGPGRTFLVGALASLRTGTPHMDLPVALGLGVGGLVGTVNAVVGRGHVYFDSLATLVFLLLIGRWIQFRQQQRAARAVDLMLRITPRHATLLSNTGQEQLVLVDTLVAGDRIRVAPGESVPADGEVTRGESSLDRSLLTGESLPVGVAVGDTVAAGTVNLTSPFDLRVTATGRDSRIGQVMQAVEMAASERTPLVQLADRIGGVFVVTVIVLAVATFLIWLPHSLPAATAHATALLIVACPCALALATPLAIAVALGRAAKGSILVRDGQALQQLASVGTLWLDKTGTLTEGRQRVSSWYGSGEGLRLAAALEAQCRHPVAQAIVREAERQQVQLPTQAELECVLPGGGVSGRVEGRRLHAGNASLMQAEGIAVPEEFAHHMQRLADHGESPILLALDGQIVSLLGLSDPIRDGARELVDELQGLGWSVGILSGDHPAIVRRVGEQLGLPLTRCFGALSPEQKLAAIRDSRHAGQTVVMVGDGANDAAALAAADVGIAIRGGAEVSLQAAPIFIASGKLLSIANLLRGAARTTRVIHSNFAISLSYNLLAVGLAMTGLISPLFAAILMPLSSVSVLALTLARKTFPEGQ